MQIQDKYFKTKESPVHGIGCFSRRELKTGTEIEVGVELFNRYQSKEWIRYSFPWDARYWCKLLNSPITYCNSSNTPNLRIKSIDKNKFTKTFIVTQDISSGEEIFLKYKVGEINGR